MAKRTALGLLGVIGLAVVGTGALVLRNWDSLVEAYDAQAEKTQATLFRWGELMSIAGELKARYGVEPDVTYDTSTPERTLNISFGEYQLPERATGEAHAREIAVFALGKTKKSRQIDAVRVLFRDPSRSFTFALSDLIPTRTQRPS